MALLLDNDYLAMASGAIQWGDLLCPREDIKPEVVDPTVALEHLIDALIHAEIGAALDAHMAAEYDSYEAAVYQGEADAFLLESLIAWAEPEDEDLDDADWECPDLRLRKDIWENFPVTVVPLGMQADGVERHAIMWHNKNLREWRDRMEGPGAPENHTVWMDYEEAQHRRLLIALKESTHWTVEPAAAADQICVIRMNCATPVKAPAVITPAPVVRAHAHVVPAINTLADLGAMFPIVWSKGTPIVLKWHNMRLREASRAAGKDMTVTLRDRLLDTLRSSTTWRVLRPQSADEICRVERA